MTQIRQYKSGKFYRDEFRGNLSWNGNEHNVLLRGRGKSSNGDLQFADVGMAMGADDVKDARGMAVADFDNDGDLDIVINNNPGDCGKKSVPPTLLRNNVGQTRNWLAVKLIGTACNRDAIGTQVTVILKTSTGQARLLRHVTAGGGYASQNSDRLYFGLNDQQSIEAIRVVWPNGTVQTLENVRTNQFLQIVETPPASSSSSSDVRTASWQALPLHSN